MRRGTTGCSFALMRTPLWVALPPLASLVLAGCSGAVDKAGGKPAPAPRKTVVLSLAVRGDPWEVDSFVSEVSRLSHGTIRIAVKPRWRYGQATYEKGLIGDVRAGKADLAAAESNAWDSAGVTSLRVLGAPLLIDSYALQDRVLRSSVIPKMLRGLRPLGLVGLGVLPGQFPRPLGVTHRLLGNADYAGERIGVQQSLVGTVTMRALGAKPVWLGGRATIAGLDGIAEPISWINGSRYDRVARYLTTNVVPWARPIVVFANRAALGRLTPAQRRVLERAATDAVGGQTRVVAEFERSDTAALCAHKRVRFLAAQPTDLTSLRVAARRVDAQLERDPLSRAFFAEVEALRARLGASPTVLPSCGQGRPVSAPGAATPLDGVYELTVAPRDLPPAQRLPEAYGSWQLVLDRSRFRFTERNDHADWIADGRVRVSGDRMSWTMDDIFGVGPHGTPDRIPLRTGETVHFRVRYVGDTLALVAADAKKALLALTQRPLARVAAAPSQQPLQNPAAIQGTWVTNATGADLVAYGEDPAAIPDNTGPLRLTVHGRRCRWTQHAPDGVHWGVGTCRFAGDTLEFDNTRTDENPEPPPFFLHWSVFHDRLTFRQAPGLSPETWAFHPWRRIG
jgi:TRAP-type C4-dicarboxylate transport system substrate-binding protein